MYMKHETYTHSMYTCTVHVINVHVHVHVCVSEGSSSGYTGLLHFQETSHFIYMNLIQKTHTWKYKMYIQYIKHV